MHSLGEVGGNVPAFLAKLWRLVDDPDTNDLICWGDEGTSFVIHNQAQFCHDLLPLYYKHNNMASFVRQLNMYGFHKKVSVDSGGLKLDRDEMEFAHPCFMRSQPYLLETIKRKITETSRSGVKSPEIINKVLVDVRQMRGRQESLDGKLSAMKRENEALWRELAVLRQKHSKQQQIVNKLIQFLLTVVNSPGNRLGLKRRQLMLHDKAHDDEEEEERHHHHHHHHRKHKHRKGYVSDSASARYVSDSASTSASVASPSQLEELSKLDEMSKGPTIHELDPNSEYILPDDGISYNSPSPALQAVAMPSPIAVALEESESPIMGLNLEQEGVTTPEIPDETALLSETTSAEKKAKTSDVAIFGGASPEDSNETTLSRWGSHPVGEELDNHVDTVQNDLDGLKELLSKDACNLDANTLLSLFADEPISFGLGLPDDDNMKGDLGSELIAYNPTLFDLSEDIEPIEDDVDDLFLPIEALQKDQPADNNGDLTTPVITPSSPNFPTSTEPPTKKKRK